MIVAAWALPAMVLPVLLFCGLERGVRQDEAAAFGGFAYWQVPGGF